MSNNYQYNIPYNNISNNYNNYWKTSLERTYFINNNKNQNQNYNYYDTEDSSSYSYTYQTPKRGEKKGKTKY